MLRSQETDYTYVKGKIKSWRRERENTTDTFAKRRNTREMK